MGIDGITPPFQDPSRYRVEQKPSAPKKPEKSATPEQAGKTSFSELVPKTQEKNVPPPPEGSEEAKKSDPANPAWLVAEEDANRGQIRYQLNQDIASLDNSILEAQRQLAKETQALAEVPVPGEEKAASYWDRLEVMEKARIINQLKDKITHLELQRNALVASLREQVLNGTYEVSGNEIFEGMQKEFL